MSDNEKGNQGKAYDSIASGFAEMRDSFSTEQKYIDLLVERLRPNSDILDVGCGSGYPIASYLLDKGFQVTGLDASKELLKIAKLKYPTIDFVYGDMRTVVLHAQYDAIIEWWSLFHIPKQNHYLMIERFASWLKPGGILEFTTGDSEYESSYRDMLDEELWFYSLSPKEYEVCLMKNGFEILLCESDQETHLVWLARYKK